MNNHFIIIVQRISGNSSLTKPKNIFQHVILISSNYIASVAGGKNKDRLDFHFVWKLISFAYRSERSV